MSAERAHEVTMKQVEDYLLSKGSSLFGKAYDLSQPESLRAAAEWILAEHAALEELGL